MDSFSRPIAQYAQYAHARWPPICRLRSWPVAPSSMSIALMTALRPNFLFDLQQCSLHVMLTPHITVRNADMAIVPLLRGRIDPGKQIKLLVAFAGRKLIRRGHIIGDDGEPAHQQTRIHDALVQHRHRLTDASGRRGELPQSDRPGGRLGDPPPIPVDGHRPAIALARLIGGPFHRRIRAGIQLGRVKAADVVADRQTSDDSGSAPACRQDPRRARPPSP